MLLLFLLLTGSAHATTRSANGYVFFDTEEPGGPPFALLDMTGSTELAIGSDQAEPLPLPFTWSLFNLSFDQVYVSSNGALFFDAPHGDATGTCPSTLTPWLGIAALWDDLTGGTIRYRTFGQYPYRVLAVEWSNVQHAGAPGSGTFQTWLTEGRQEVVVAMDDLDFGDPQVDGGAGAVVGMGSPTGGLDWSCVGGLAGGQAGWWGPEHLLPSRSTVAAGDLAHGWSGGHDGAGARLATGDVNDDDLSDLLVYEQDDLEGVVYLLYGPATAAPLAEAASTWRASMLEQQLGTGLALGDLDGDGYDDISIGAPGFRGLAPNQGAAYICAGWNGAAGTYDPAEECLALAGPSISEALTGYNLAVPGDTQGDGYLDLLVSAPGAGLAGQGAVYLVSGGSDLSSGDLDTLASARFVSPQAWDALGDGMGGADTDGSGSAEILLSARAADGNAIIDAGALWVLPDRDPATGAPWSGILDITTVASATIRGASSSDALGASFATGDFDGDGLVDLLLGAPFRDGASDHDLGAAYIFGDLGSMSGDYTSSEADSYVEGPQRNAFLGFASSAGDLDRDGRDEVILGAYNATANSLPGAGEVFVFDDPVAGAMDLGTASFRIQATAGIRSLGNSLVAVGDWTGDGYGDIAMGAPFSTLGGAWAVGDVLLWEYSPDFPDDDDDGFVSTDAGVMDCDDGDSEIFPGAAEILDNGMDDDCDGWIDQVLRIRPRSEWWNHDMQERWGVVPTPVLDFESGVLGTDVTGLYTPESVGLGFELPNAAILEVSGDVFGASPQGAQAARLSAADDNSLTILFPDGVDAFALQLLDARDPLALSAVGADGPLWETPILFEATGDNLPGGTFVGLEFARTVHSLHIEGSPQDGWGLDDLTILWATETDSDDDGYSDAGGDCDDTDPTIGPQAAEDFFNGQDDDCDGVIDGGRVILLDDPAIWMANLDWPTATVDFESPPWGSTLLDQYRSTHGVTFQQVPIIVDQVDGAACMGTHAAQAQDGSGSYAMTLVFTETQRAIAFWLLDGEYDFHWSATAGGTQIHSTTLSRAGNDVAGGLFAGFLFDVPIESFTIEASANVDIFGIDDLTLMALGQDDADLDGFTEADGDCDDADATVGPEAEETWYDGVDQDCQGEGDYDADQDGFEFTVDCDDQAVEINPEAAEVWYDGVDQDCLDGSDYDADQDGFDDVSWGGPDCDDGSASVHPDTPEVFYDGIDQNCEEADEYDSDGDGYSRPGASVEGALGAGDCDDTSSAAWPGAPETWYDGIDSDCGGLVESDFDQDADGYDHWLAPGGTDCNDGDPAVSPSVSGDPCYDGVDQDCDGLDDYDCDRDGFFSWVYNGPDCDDGDPDIFPGAPDLVGDGVDSNCGADSDFDLDRDGYDGLFFGGTDCNDLNVEIHPDAPETCSDGMDQDCDGLDDFDCDADGFDATSQGGRDCDDTNPAMRPDAADTCYDGADLDCDGSNDYDCDHDGHGALAWGGDDCDDSSSAIHPGAQEFAYDEIDSNCDGISDFDSDGDGHDSWYYDGDDCDDRDPTVFPGAPDPCYDDIDNDCDGLDDYDCDADGHRPPQFGGIDCDDTTSLVSPLVIENCPDNLDNDCNGLVDDCIDVDEDGFIADSMGGDDCDDNDPTIHPGGANPCYDGIDQDCSGGSDYDCDGDGHIASPYGGDDCDDTLSTVHPGASERWYDGIDEACDSKAPEDDFDRDGDGFGADLWGGTDCNDIDPMIHPGIKADDCRYGDEDCDGLTDEDCVPWQDTSDTDDTGSEDTHETGSTDDSSTETDTDTGAGADTDTSDTPESGDTAHVDSTAQDTHKPTSDPVEVLWGDGCDGCSDGKGGSDALAWMGLIGLILAGRRRETP